MNFEAVGFKVKFGDFVYFSFENRTQMSYKFDIFLSLGGTSHRKYNEQTHAKWNEDIFYFRPLIIVMIKLVLLKM